MSYVVLVYKLNKAKRNGDSAREDEPLNRHDPCSAIVGYDTVPAAA